VLKFIFHSIFNVQVHTIKEGNGDKLSKDSQWQSTMLETS